MAASSRPTVLVVEDEPSFVEALKVGLARDGFRVVVASDGMQALTAFDVVQPDVVLLDVMLPDANGYEVCGRWRAEHPGLGIDAHFCTGPH